MTTYEIVLEFLENGEVSDYVVLDLYPNDLDEATKMASEQPISKDERIAIWKCDDDFESGINVTEVKIVKEK